MIFFYFHSKITQKDYMYFKCENFREDEYKNNCEKRKFMVDERQPRQGY